MINEVAKEGEIKMNNRKSPLKISNYKTFQMNERQIPKHVKTEKQFEDFLLEI